MSGVLFLLVGGFKHLDYFPFYLWDVILPIDSYVFKMVIAPPPTRLGMNVNINTFGLWLWLLAIQQYHTIPWLLHHQAVCSEGMYFAIYVHN